jgi:hypothetical protein
MHCKACDIMLTDLETSRRSVTTDEYLDLCNACYSYIAEDVPSVVNPDFEEDSEDSYIEDDYEKE